MNRRLALVALLGAVASFSATVGAQRPPKIGYLILESFSEQPSREREAFLDALAEFGWVDGTSMEILYRSAQNEPDFLRPLCEELVREEVDALTTVGELATLACLDTTRTVPIVFLAFGDPVGAGASESLARPDRNATGVSLIQPELAAKRIEFLGLAVPAAKRVAFLWDPRNRIAYGEAQSAQEAARRAGMQPVSLPAASQASLNRRLQQLADERPDALYVVFAPGIVPQNRTAIIQFALRHRLAVISAWSSMTEAGGLLSYAPELSAVFRRGAYYVDRILDGVQPSELPIEQPGKVNLVINVSTAQRLGLTLPPELLLRATRLVE